MTTDTRYREYSGYDGGILAPASRHAGPTAEIPHDNNGDSEVVSMSVEESVVLHRAIFKDLRPDLNTKQDQLNAGRVAVANYAYPGGVSY